MQLQERIKALAALGNHLEKYPEEKLTELALKAQSYNAWFTVENVFHAFKGIIKFLKEEKLKKLTEGYEIKDLNKEVGLVFAGNIPLVGFHDLLCVLLSGNRAVVKLSSKDEILPEFIIDQLKEVEPELHKKVSLVDKLKDFEAVIATGSNNTSRYFEYYFKKYPNIIRKNRSSVAVLTGKETSEELKALGHDLLLYFGLGCRNVSKLYVPRNYEFEPLFKSLETYKDIIHHHKYTNNYDYYKSIYLVNREPFLDTGFLMFKEDTAMVSPIGVVFYEYYDSLDEVNKTIDTHNEQIQCIVAAENTPIKHAVAPGKAQLPEIDDFADRVDTMEFLTRLD